MGEEASPTGSSPGYPFIGRQAELEVITNGLNRLASDCGGVVVIEGRPGIGTSRLLGEALLRAGFGMPVLHAIGGGHWLTEFLTHNIRSPHDAVASITESCERLAGAAPFVLLMEDLDRADPKTLDVVQAVVSGLGRLPVLLVVTTRPAPRPPVVDRLLMDWVVGGAAHLRLRSLNPAETMLLATAVAETDPEAARPLLDRTGGNPQLIVGLIRALAVDGVLADSSKVPSGLPVRLRPLVLSWLACLPRATVDLLRVAAVLGPRFEVTHLARITAKPVVRLLPALEDALRAGVLEHAGAQLTIQPEFLREALYDDIAPAIRKALHTDVSRALTKAGAPASTVAEHLVRAGAPGDAQVLRCLQIAAQNTLLGSPPAAADLLHKAIEGAGSGLRDALLADLVVAQLWSGHPGEAERMARELLERPHAVSVSDSVRLVLIETLRHQGRYREAAREAAALLSTKHLSPRTRVRLRAQHAHALLFDGDPTGARAAAATAAEEANRLQDTCAVSMVCAVQSAIVLGTGRVALAVKLATDSVEHVHRRRMVTAGDTHSLALSLHTLGLALLLADRPDDSERVIIKGLQAAEALGNMVAVPSYRLLLAVLRFRTGRWDEAIADAEAGLTMARAAGVSLGVAPATGVLAMIAVHRNELARVDDLLVDTPAMRTPGAQWVEWARGLYEEAAGRGSAAASALRQAWLTCTRSGESVYYPLLGPDLVRILVAVGEPTVAQRTTVQVEEVAARIGTAAARGLALRCHGLLRSDPQSLQRAADVLAGQPYPLAAAQASEEAAMVGDPPSGTVALLEAAYSGFRSLGARRDLARVEARLRSIGVRRGQFRHRRRGGSGWDSLTMAERGVVALVTEGLTNREIAERLFISPRTAETHLTHVFAKLDLTGRRALRRAAVRSNAIFTSWEPPLT